MTKNKKKTKVELTHLKAHLARVLALNLETPDSGKVFFLQIPLHLHVNLCIHSICAYFGLLVDFNVKFMIMRKWTLVSLRFGKFWKTG